MDLSSADAVQIASDLFRTVGLELAIFAVTLCVALVIRASGTRHVRHCKEEKVEPPETPAKVHVQQRRNVDLSPASIVNEIIDGMQQQQSIKFAFRALTLYEDLRRCMATQNLKLQDVVRHAKHGALELYTTLVQCAIRASRHHVIEALFDDMAQHGVARPLNLYESTMKQLAGQKQYSVALSIFNRLEADGLEPSPVTYSCLIGFASEVGELNRAVTFFQRLAALTTPSIRAYMMILRVHAKRQDWQASVEVLQDMRSRGVKPDSLALNVALATGISADRVEAVSDAVAEAEAATPSVVDIVSYNTLIKGYAQRGNFDGAAKVLQRLRERGLQGNAITFNTCMDAAVRSLQCSRAWELLKDMKSLGVQPDKFTCSILVKGLSRIVRDAAGAPRWAERVDSTLAILAQVDSSLDATLRSTLHHSVLESVLNFAEGKATGVDLTTKVITQMRRFNVPISPALQRQVFSSSEANWH